MFRWSRTLARDTRRVVSQENVDIVRRIYAAWAKGEFGGGVAHFDPEIVFESFVPDSRERRVYRGPEGVASFMREFLAVWEDYRLVGEEFKGAGDNKVFVAGYQSATGRHSGVAVRSPTYSVWTFRDGKVVHLIMEFDRHKALEAAGLSD